MSKNNFDHLIRSKFDELELPYSEDSWFAMREELTLPALAKKTYFHKKVIGLVAAMALFAIIWSGVLYEYMNEQGDQVALAEPVKSTELSNEKEQLKTPVVPANQPFSALGNNFPVANAYSKYLNKPFNTPNNRSVIIVESGAQEDNTIVAQTTTSYNDASVVITQTEVVKQQPALPALPIVASKDLLTGPAVNAYEEVGNSNTKNLQLGVVGNLGYGGESGNGYALGVNTINKISKRLYLENVVAFGRTQEFYNIQGFQSPTASATAAAAKGSSQSNVALNLKGNLFYVSLAPSLRFKVNKGISVGAGGDVQRIVRNTIATPQEFYTDYISDNNGALVISNPVKWNNWDAGITAKATYNVTNRLDLGIQYRKGLTNLLSQQPGMDLRRSYGVISLQYKILGSDGEAAK